MNEYKCKYKNTKHTQNAWKHLTSNTIFCSVWPEWTLKAKPVNSRSNLIQHLKLIQSSLHRRQPTKVSNLISAQPPFNSLDERR